MLLNILLTFAAIISILGLIISMQVSRQQIEKPKELSKTLVKHPFRASPMIWTYIIFVAAGWAFIAYLIVSGKYPAY